MRNSFTLLCLTGFVFLTTCNVGGFAYELKLDFGFLKLGKSLFNVDLFGRNDHSLSNEVLDPDCDRDITQLITSKGYPAEEHDVPTKDGYILGVKRIPRGVTEEDKAREGSLRPAIYLHHGLLSSGADWVMNGPNMSLGFILADAGYDVWIGNARGNTYSRKHTKYSANDPKFWQFSWDEMALIDLPAAIDYILDVTGQKQLYYVGHSMGTTIGFAMLSEMPEYNEKVKAFIALAPVATVGYMTSPVRYLAPFANDLGFILAMIGQNEFVPNSALIHIWSDLVCTQNAVKELCQNLMFIMGGIESKQMNYSRIPVYAHHSPAGTSTMTVLHYAQMALSKEFTKYDYGPFENMRIYDKNHPPKYEVENISTPVALLWSQNDLMADPTDVALLKPRIKNLIEDYEVPFPAFTHVDFVYGIDANKYVYEKVLSILKSTE